MHDKSRTGRRLGRTDFSRKHQNPSIATAFERYLQVNWSDAVDGGGLYTLTHLELYIDCERAFLSCRMASSRTSAILRVLLLLVSLVNVTYMLRLYHQHGRADYSKTYPYLGG